MNTKIILTASGLTLGVSGILLTFLPQEILSILNVDVSKPLQLLVQTIGALYFAFGLMNWMVREGAMGGIYNRPIAVANVSHFSIAGLAFLKTLFLHPNLPLLLWIPAGIYTVFAISFSILLFRHPFDKN